MLMGAMLKVAGSETVSSIINACTSLKGEGTVLMTKEVLSQVKSLCCLACYIWSMLI